MQRFAEALGFRGSSTDSLNVSGFSYSCFMKQPQRGLSNHLFIRDQISARGSVRAFPIDSGVRSQGQTLPSASMKR